jgi:putative Ca2+/H+ antiporter (TMEM165/GDT1 family)
LLAVFPLVFGGEWPDKTMFGSLVMASRGRPVAAWAGATAAAFTVRVTIATSIGVARFHLLPHRGVRAQTLIGSRKVAGGTIRSPGVLVYLRCR